MTKRILTAAALIGTALVGAAELLVQPPVTAPIAQLPWWRLERARFGYKPEFDAGIACFGPDNEPYLRFGETVQMLDARGHWLRVPLAPAVTQRFNTWDGVFMQGYFAEEHIVFDDAGDAYAIVNATRSSIGRVFLLHSRDRCRSWQAYPIGLGYARLERRDGHTRMQRPPAVLVHDSALRGILQLVVPEKRADGTLDVGHSKVISEDSLLVANHSGGGNSLVTIGTRIHVFFPGKTPIPGKERVGTPEYAVTYDIEKRTLTDPVFLGFGGSGKPDAHNIPVVSVDSEGILHVVLGAHHDPFKYTHSLAPDSTVSGWSEPEPFGTLKRSPNEGSYTYVGLVCDSKDALHVVGRWAGESYTFKLGYLRKPKGKPWEPNRNLVTPSKGNYHVWYHKLTIDRQDRLFLNYVCRASIKRPDEVPSFGKKWPSADLSTRFLTQSHCLLMSADHGDSWRLATTPDLGGQAKDGLPDPVEPAPEPETAAIAAAPTGQLGGGFGELALAGDFLLAGVGKRVLVMDVSRPESMRVVGQAGPFTDTIYDLEVRDGIVVVAAWRAGLHLFALADDGSLTPRGVWTEGEARRFDWQGNLLYLTSGRAGLHILDVSEPDRIRQAGRLPAPELCAIAVRAGLAYGAVGPNGMTIMDVSEPAKPTRIGSMFSPTSSTDRRNAAYNVVVAGDVLYVCPGPALSCLRTFSLDDPRNPREVADHETNWGWGRPLQASDERLYLASLNGLQIMQADPAAKVLGTWGDGGVRGVAARGTMAFVSRGVDGITALDVSDASAPASIAVYAEPAVPFGCAADGDRLAVADWGSGVRILDLTTPDMPTEVRMVAEYPHVFGLDADQGRLALALGADGAALADMATGREIRRLSAGAPVRDVAIDGATVFLAEEGRTVRMVNLHTGEETVLKTPREPLSIAASDARLYVGEAQEVLGGIRVYALGKGAPAEMSYLELGNDVWDLAVSGSQVFASQADRGVRIVDASDGKLKLAGSIDVNGAIAWGSAPAVGRIYVAVGSGGIQIRRVGAPR